MRHLLTALMLLTFIAGCASRDHTHPPCHEHKQYKNPFDKFMEKEKK